MGRAARVRWDEREVIVTQPVEPTGRVTARKRVRVLVFTLLVIALVVLGLFLFTHAF